MENAILLHLTVKFMGGEKLRAKETDPVCQINVESVAKYAIYKNNVKYFRNASLLGSLKKKKKTYPTNCILNPTFSFDTN